MLAAQRKGILILAADVEFFGHDLYRFGHGIDAVLGLHQRIDEAPTDRRVLNLHATRKRCVCFAHNKWGAGHALHAAGDHQRGFAALEGARRDGYRIHAGTAEPIDGRAGHFLRQTGEEKSHAADVAVILASLVRTSVDHVVQRVPRYFGIAFDEGSDGNSRQVVSPDG